MAERTTLRTIAFSRPFRLADGMQPAGLYEVETTEEQIEGLSFVAFRRISTTITPVGSPASTRSRQRTTVEPTELDAALAGDALGAHPGA